MSEAVTALEGLGLSMYEAKAYTTLLLSESATAYELSQASGIPTSKVYEVLHRLVGKGLVTRAEGSAGARYVAQEPEVMLRAFRERVLREIDGLEHTLGALRRGTRTHFVWNVDSYEVLVERVEDMLAGAEERFVLAAWDEEFTRLEDACRTALERKVRIALVSYGLAELPGAVIYRHGMADQVHRELSGRTLIAVADHRCAASAVVRPGGVTEGTWSEDPGFVLIADEYVRHEIYLLKIFSHLGPVVELEFGPEHERLRDIWSP